MKRRLIESPINAQMRVSVIIWVIGIFPISRFSIGSLTGFAANLVQVGPIIPVVNTTTNLSAQSVA